MALGFALLPFWVLGFATTDAPSGQTPIRVSLEAPADCATAESFYEGVRDRTDRVRTAVDDETTVEVSVRLVRAGSKVQGELRMHGEHGHTDTRRVEGATCEEVVEALSLTAALALDPTARLVAREPSEPTPSRPAPPPEPTPAPEPTPPSASPRPRFTEFSLGVQALVTQVVTPDMSFGGAVAGRLTFDPEGSGESISVSILHLRNDLLRTPNDALYKLTGFALTGCPVRLRLSSATTLEPCATTLAGWLTAEALHVEHQTTTVRTYWSAGGILVIRVAAGAGAALEVFGGATAPLTMRHFSVGVPPTPIGETPVISPLAGFGFSWAF